MKTFTTLQQREAIEYALNGGVALHIFPTGFGRKDMPRCFKVGNEIGHLFCQSEITLKIIGKKIGIRKICIHHRGTRSQHIDLCARPLEKMKIIIERENK